MKSLLPWVLVVALLGGTGFLYSSNRAKDAQLASSKQSYEDTIAQLHAENDELKKTPVQHDELDRLRKEHDELLRLRGEAQRLRDQVKQLTNELAVFQRVAKQAEDSQAQVARQINENRDLRTQAERDAAEQQLGEAQRATCIDILRAIDAAKQQWAQDHNKSANDVPTPEDLTPYFKNPSTIMCPAGGTYTINAVGVLPTCSVASHVMTK